MSAASEEAGQGNRKRKRGCFHPGDAARRDRETSTKSIQTKFATGTGYPWWIPAPGGALTTGTGKGATTGFHGPPETCFKSNSPSRIRSRDFFRGSPLISETTFFKAAAGNQAFCWSIHANA